MDTVIVIMSTYNGEKYLKEQLDSILVQENVIVKIVVRDDGSTDGTYKILEGYAAENKIILLPKSENIGWKKSFIDCLRAAPVGDYYAFSDQDDVWEKGKLIAGVKRLKELNENFPNLYISNSWITDESLNPIGNLCERDLDISSLTPYEIWLHPGIQGGCGQIFNNKAREMVLKVKNYPFGHDNLMERVCGFLGTIIYDNEPHFYYRQHYTNVIGARISLQERILHWIKMVFLHESSESLAASCFLEAFGDILSKKICNFLVLCRDAHKNILSRIKLVKWKGFRKQTLDETIVLKIRTLIGRY